MSTEDCWATGIFEGEGSIILIKKCSSVHLLITMTDLDILERIEKLFGGKIYKRNVANKKWKQAWRWQVSRRAEVKQVLERMLPLLGERRACKAQDALDHLDKIYTT
jgi:hypothetical protein